MTTKNTPIGVMVLVSWNGGFPWNVRVRVFHHSRLYACLSLELSLTISDLSLGATALAHGLRGNSVLEQLKLTGNRIGNAGTTALMSSLVGLSRGFLAELWLARCGGSRIEIIIVGLDILFLFCNGNMQPQSARCSIVWTPGVVAT